MVRRWQQRNSPNQVADCSSMKYECNEQGRAHLFLSHYRRKSSIVMHSHLERKMAQMHIQGRVAPCIESGINLFMVPTDINVPRKRSTCIIAVHTKVHRGHRYSPL